MSKVEETKQRIAGPERALPGASLGERRFPVEATLADFDRRGVIGRIWHGDHTLWKPDPKEIVNRLGWLTVSEAMRGQVASLEAFAGQVRDAGFRHVVLVGMGGSSLAAKVLRQTFGDAGGSPELVVLDSTLPALVREATDRIDPASTLFLIASKSGTTLEPNLLYSYFQCLVERALGPRRAGERFVAITDPDTPLETLARTQGFRRIFLNPPDVGGRYSALSYFGLVPAALMGIDGGALLDSARRMALRCASDVPARDSPGAQLGAAMGALALRGRDKLTLVASPSIDSFGPWVEQLVAESLGKDGKGVVPITGEPLLSPEHYGDDRLFVYLRLDGDDNARIDAAMERIEAHGHPVAHLALGDRRELGAEFFRWQFATAAAATILGVHPFDQPDVQQTKDLATQALQEYDALGRVPRLVSSGSPKQLLARAREGDYLAVMAYLPQTPEMDQALSELRRLVMERHRIATTLGYGPAFLHSTGQLHKGGPPTGLFLQLTATDEAEARIPGESYTFGTLWQAQAQADLRALRRRGRRVARAHLSGGGVEAVRSLAAQLAS